MTAVILTMSLTACGSNDVENIPDEQDASENAISETSDESLLEPETYEDYIKLADTYLQTDDVIQALAVLDEGIEKLSTGGQGAESQDIDLLSQRKEYILAGTIAVRTEYVENEYDDEEEIRFGYTSERDENGNEIIFTYYGTERQVTGKMEFRYDVNGNKIEYEDYEDYSNGVGSRSYHSTWEYDANGKELEWVSYNMNGNIVERTEREYDDFGNEIKYARYGSDGECTNKTIQEYDERGNLIRLIMYNNRGILAKQEFTYDNNGKEIKGLCYKGDTTITSRQEREYDENGYIVRLVDYNVDGDIFIWHEHAYDENGNQIKFVSYDGDGSINYIWEYEYDQNGREIYEKHYNSNSIITDTLEYEYDERGNKIKETKTSYNEETEQKESQTIDEYEYDENENMTKYAHIVYDKEKETDSRMWERKYDADGRETDFYLYINEKTASYHSQKEYDENGRMISYTEYDKNGNVFSRKETEYDADGNAIRENHYDVDGSLIRCYENEYDNFGSITRQAVYEGGILKSEIQTSYVYRYIGNVDMEVSDEMTPEEYNLWQREIFNLFLKGQEMIRYQSRGERVEDGVIVRKSITNLIDFSYCRQNKKNPQYTFLDMTGDGVEELIISCDRGELYVIQNDNGVLIVIFNTPEYRDTNLVKGNGRTGICVSYGGRDGSTETYYFLDENGKKEISLRTDWDSEDEKSYCVYDNDSFTEYGISKGEYYDITDKTITLADIEWQKLEDPNYGND